VSVRLSVCLARWHTHRDAPGNGMRRGQRAFQPDDKEDWHTCFTERESIVAVWCGCCMADCCCGSKSQLEKPWYRANDTDENNKAARRAYESLMTITLRKPDSPEYFNFSRQVIQRARQYSGGIDAYDDDDGVTCCVVEFYFVNKQRWRIADFAPHPLLSLKAYNSTDRTIWLK